MTDVSVTLRFSTDVTQCQQFSVVCPEVFLAVICNEVNVLLILIQRSLRTKQISVGPKTMFICQTMTRMTHSAVQRRK